MLLFCFLLISSYANDEINKNETKLKKNRKFDGENVGIKRDKAYDNLNKIAEDKKHRIKGNKFNIPPLHQKNQTKFVLGNFTKNDDFSQQHKENQHINSKGTKYEIIKNKDEENPSQKSSLSDHFSTFVSNITSKIQLISVIPNRVSVEGRTEVVMYVRNAQPGMCFAKFGGEIVAGEINKEGEAFFHAPMHKPGNVTVQFSKDRIKWYGDIEIEYYEEKHANILFVSFIVGFCLSLFIGCGLFFFFTGDSTYHNDYQAVPSLEGGKRKRKLNIKTNSHKTHAKQRYLL